MDTLISVLYIVLGFFLRLAIPILGTAILVFLLRRLDARWQAEAARQPLPTNKPDCWKIKGCPSDEMEKCPGAKSSLPCWQVYRLPNGYLNEDCITCKVFIEAPVPTLTIEPRRL
ncbi:MAG TPA: hypothetical protein VK909_10855 [Anaerolineales bacterium]|jgi:hypothetical protein|nr:hypothetical protein [Anaerolineales bacterium]